MVTLRTTEDERQSLLDSWVEGCLVDTPWWSSACRKADRDAGVEMPARWGEEKHVLT